MHTQPPDDSLSRTLAAWRVAPPTDPQFRPSVWRRIRRAENETWPAYLRAHLAPCVVAAVLLAGAAGWAGRAAALARLQADREAMVTTYLIDLDPRLQAGLRP